LLGALLEPRRLSMADKNIFAKNVDNLTSQAAVASERYSALIADPAVSKDAQLIGAAITLAGAQIATALFQVKEAR
jgi:hypothetical protein